MNFLITDVKELIESYNKKTATVIAHDWVCWEVQEEAARDTRKETGRGR